MIYNDTTTRTGSEYVSVEPFILPGESRLGDHLVWRWLVGIQSHRNNAPSILHVCCTVALIGLNAADDQIIVTAIKLLLSYYSREDIITWRTYTIWGECRLAGGHVRQILTVSSMH